MQPLAEILRPKKLSEVCGHEKLLATNQLLSQSIDKKSPLSCIFYGPPGCGKTTIAKIYSSCFTAPSLTVQATHLSIQEIKKQISHIKENPLLHSSFILFIDEIHRLTTTQQDFFLPYIESGLLVLIGATTQNVNYYLNPALLSRVKVFSLSTLCEESLKKIATKALNHVQLSATDEAIEMLCTWAQGDGRYLLYLIHMTSLYADTTKPITEDILYKTLDPKQSNLTSSSRVYHQLISALQKSIRGSDPDASLYWYQRLLLAGIDIHLIQRRLLVIASEDIGLADPRAIEQVNSCIEAFEKVGMPEGEMILAQAIIYLSLAPKSNSVYKANQLSQKSAQETQHKQVPPQIAFHGHKNYKYDHDCHYGFSGQNFFPGDVTRKFYYPQDRGFERELQKRLSFFKKLKEKTP